MKAGLRKSAQPLKPIRIQVDWLTFKSAAGNANFKPSDLYGILHCLGYPTRAQVKVRTSNGSFKLGRLTDLKFLSNSEWREKLKLSSDATTFKITCDLGELGLYLILENNEIQLQVRGAYFAKPTKDAESSPFEFLQKQLIPALSKFTSSIFILIRSDIAQDYADIDWFEILPTPKDEKSCFAFKATMTTYGTTKGEETGYKYYSAKRWTLRIYNKLLENLLPKNYNTEKQKYYAELYASFEKVTRVELSIATARDNKTATEAFYDNFDEQKFCYQVLSRWSQRHRVRVKTSDKNQSRWPTEKRWSQVFQTEKTLTKTDFIEIKSNEITTERIKGKPDALTRRAAAIAVDEGLSESEYIKKCVDAYQSSKESKPTRDNSRLKTDKWLSEIQERCDSAEPREAGEQVATRPKDGQGTDL